MAKLKSKLIKGGADEEAPESAFSMANIQSQLTKKRWKLPTWAWILIVLVILVIIVAVAVWFWRRGGDEEYIPEEQYYYKNYPVLQKGKENYYAPGAPIARDIRVGSNESDVIGLLES